MPGHQKANYIMMKLLKLFITYQLKDTKPRQKPSGFTLLELLIGLILAFIVITPLLGFMISIMNQDRQEQAKAASEQEIQSALNYISRDIDQAIFIYDGNGLPQIANQLPQVNSGVPVLVFWKRKFLPKSLPVRGAADCNDQTRCDDAFVYSLVAYYQITENPCTNKNWSCTSRIGRVEMREALVNVNNPSGGGSTPASVPNQEKSPGFKLFDLNQPNASNLEEAMNNWTNDNDTEIDKNQPEILIDYIDKSSGQNVPPASCSTAPRDGTTLPYQYRQVPPPTPSTPSSFYACVDTDKTIAQVFIRGNALARIKPKQNPPAYVPSQQAYFPKASIQAQGRGLVKLTPDS
jgi:type II secretory pathway pseudopilin PulG